jgi:uncharacterized protein
MFGSKHSKAARLPALKQSCFTWCVGEKQLIVFVKAPRAGEVKTRLAQSIGAEQACAAYREMVETVLRRIETIKGVEVRFTPDDASAEVTPWVRGDWKVAAQGAGDLGERLERAINDAFSAGAKQVAVIGSDCVELNAPDIRACFRELETHDVVVGPATDGGYWIIGLKAARPELFQGIAWSTDQVLAQTLSRAKESGLRIQLFRILPDIDTVEDWERFKGGEV